jgi:hypothetical protein
MTPRQPTTTPWLTSSVCFLLALWFGGCSSQTPIPTDDPLIIAMSSISSTQGTALQGATGLQGQASKVEVFMRSNANDPSTAQIVTASVAPIPFSIPLGLPNVPTRIAVLDIPAGYVTQVRIEVDGLFAVFPDHQTPINLPGNALRITPNGTFPVTAGAESDMLVPLDPRAVVTPSCSALQFTLATTGFTGLIAQAVDVDPVVLSTSLNVRFSAATSKTTISTLVAGFNAGATVNWVQPSNLVNVSIPAGGLVSAAVSYFSALPGVVAVTVDRLQRTVGQPSLKTPPNDFPGTGLVYAPYYHQAVFEAHNITEGDSLPVIAILDTGANLANPDLALNVWINEGELPAAMQANGKPGSGADFDNDGIVTFRDLNMPGHDSFLAQFNIGKDQGDPAIVDAL